MKNKDVFRFRILASCLLSLFVSCASQPRYAEHYFSPGEWTSGTRVQTRYGILEGAKDKNDTLVWRGIPYAAAPTGDLRWKAPREARPWEGVRSATRSGNKSVQIIPYINMVSGSEDCLYLNVWRPASDKKKLPVYVWIHGGGNSTGSSDMVQDYHGYPISSSLDLVFVSVNYRLNLSGWLSHPALRDGTNAEDDSGNYGTLDIIHALKWIQENINAFGGDPDNVTLAGQSAGGLNVLSMLMIPRAQGLFHKAIVQSGYRMEATREEADAYGHEVVRRLLIDRGKAKDAEMADSVAAEMGPKKLAAWLRSQSASSIMNATGKPFYMGMREFPYLIKDGAVVPFRGFDVLGEPAESVSIPVIIGGTKEETKFFSWVDKWDYLNPETQLFVDFTSARWKARGADAVADMLSSVPGRAPVYLYRFDWGAVDKDGNSVLPGESGKKIGCFHTIDVSFFIGHDVIMGGFFPVPLTSPENEKGRKALQHDIRAYLGAFIRTGNPNPATGDAPPCWEKWEASSKNPSFQVLDADLTGSRVHQAQGRTRIPDLDAWLETWPEAQRTKMKKHLAERDYP